MFPHLTRPRIFQLKKACFVTKSLRSLTNEDPPEVIASETLEEESEQEDLLDVEAFETSSNHA